GISLLVNVVVIGWGVVEVLRHPGLFADWRRTIAIEHGNPIMMLGFAFLLFPKLALGLSGFETGVAVMPLVRGDGTDAKSELEGPSRNRKKLLGPAGAVAA